MDVLFECIRQGGSPFTAAAFCKNYLLDHGFREIKYGKKFDLGDSDRCLVCPFPDTIFAFTTGRVAGADPDLRMAFAHLDQPCLKVKGRPDIKSMDCHLLNVEIYGGMKESTWFDRPLGMAGQVVLKGEEVFRPETVTFDSGRPVALIPGLATHMRKRSGDTDTIDRQNHMLPLAGLAGSRITEGAFMSFLADELKVDRSEILSYDLSLYNFDEPQLVGFENDFISSPRLDNLASVSAMLEALTEADRRRGINLIGIFNHEEVGSRSRSGADSDLLREVLVRILYGAGLEDDRIADALTRGHYLSVDGAQGAHPNYPECYDLTARAYMGQGPAVKVSASQRYATDCIMEAILLTLSEKYDFPLQEINDRNTIRGGSTIGPMIGADIPMPGCDVGIPMLAMHSARETICADDYDSMCQLLTAFFTE